MTQSFYIPVRLPGLNEYINVCRRNRYEASAFKANYQDLIHVYLLKGGVVKVDSPCRYTFIWNEHTLRRDRDNVAFAKKFILDSLVQYRYIKDDSPKFVTGFVDLFINNKALPEGVQVIIEEEEDAD